MKHGGNTLFLVRYDIGSNYLRDHPLTEQPGFAEHAKYMGLEHAAGNLLFGGLLLNHLEAYSVTGGALLYRACSEKEARDFAMRDPAVQNSVFEIKDIKHWVPMVGELSDASPSSRIWPSHQGAISA